MSQLWREKQRTLWREETQTFTPLPPFDVIMLNQFVSGLLRKWAIHSRLALAGIAPAVAKMSPTKGPPPLLPSFPPPVLPPSPPSSTHADPPLPILMVLLTDDSTSTAAPELVQVVYVTRHGLRTPLSDSKNTVSGFPWECLPEEETIRIFTQDVELHRADQGPERDMDPSSISRSRLPPGLFEPVFSGDKDLQFGKNCHAGQLTVAGHHVRGPVDGVFCFCFPSFSSIADSYPFFLL